MDTTLKLRQLRALVGVAHANRITRAADALNISQPAISRLIRCLEDALGVALFERTRARMVPTPCGLVLIAGTERAFAHLRAAEEMIATHEVAAAGALARQVADHELLAIVAIAKSRHFGLAAQSLAISPTAVKRSLAAIEARIGTPLFVAKAHQIQPTEAGEVVVRAAQLALSEIEQARIDLADLAGMTSAGRKLCIGALPLSRAHLVPIAVSRLVREMPHLEVTIVDGSYDNLLKDLCSDEIDIIVGTLRDGANSQWVVSECLFDDTLAIVARADHPIFHQQRQIPLAELCDARWVLPRRGVPLRAQFEHLIQEQGLNLPRQIIEVDSFTAARSFLLADDWLAVLSRSQIYCEEQNGLLRTVPLPETIMTRPVGFTLRNGQSPSRAVEILIRHMRTIARDLIALAIPARSDTMPISPEIAASPSGRRLLN